MVVKGNKHTSVSLPIQHNGKELNTKEINQQMELKKKKEEEPKI